MLAVTPQERLALGVTALLLAAGAGARILAPDPPAVQWEQKGEAASDTSQGDELGATRRAAEKALARERLRAQPLAEGERVDPNRATADEIDRLPRIGPALAARIVEWRTGHGPFRSLADVDSVPGIGPSLLGQIAPLLTLPAAPGSSRRAGSAPGGALELNRATAAELDALPGIGPVLAQRVVKWREEHGPFRSVKDLEQVPGIGPALREKLSTAVRAGP